MERDLTDEFGEVEKPRYEIPVDDLRKVIDLDLFVGRVNELLESGKLDEGNQEVLKRFMIAYNNRV